MEAIINREVARELVRYQLIRCRELGGKLQKEAAAELGVRQPHYAQFEIGGGPNQRRPDQQQLATLLTFFGMEDRLPILSQVLDIARSGTPGGKYGIGMISDLDLYLGLEHFATSLTVYEPLLIHGLLQTRDYARVLVEHVAATTPELDADTALELRMKRQLQLRRTPTPLQLTAYIEERALSTTIGDPQIMRAQLQHLLDQGRRRNITIRILPETNALRPTGSRPLALLRFTNQWRMVYAETPVSAHYYDAPATIEHCATIMGGLQHLALDAADSRRLIDAAVTQVGA